MALNARLTQEPVEVLAGVTAAPAVLTQEPVEVLAGVTAAPAVLTQEAVEVLANQDSLPNFLTQIVVEVLQSSVEGFQRESGSGGIRLGGSAALRPKKQTVLAGSAKREQDCSKRCPPKQNNPRKCKYNLMKYVRPDGSLEGDLGGWIPAVTACALGDDGIKDEKLTHR